MTQHTKTPWKTKEGSMFVCTDTGGIENLSIAEMKNTAVLPAAGNAAFIVRACNSHEKLIALAEAMLGFEIETPKDYKTKGADAFSPLCRHIIDLQNQARKVLAEVQQ